MPTKNVVLTEHHVKVIEGLVRSGRYQNASEVLREGLRLVEQREAEDAARLEALRKLLRLESTPSNGAITGRLSLSPSSNVTWSARVRQ